MKVRGEPWTGAFLQGLKDGLNLPALGIMGALVGYGVMAREAGLDLFLTMLSVATIWAMPVLMGFAELVSNSASPLLALVTLLAIGFRNLPMAVSAIPMIRDKPGFRWNHILMAQLLSPTAWVQITTFGRGLKPPDRMPYYVAFSLSLLSCSLFGAWLGHSHSRGLDPAISVTLLFLTPLFVTLTLATSPKLTSRLAMVAGGIGVPLLMQWDSELGLIIGGFLFGTAGYGLGRMFEVAGNRRAKE